MSEWILARIPTYERFTFHVGTHIHHDPDTGKASLTRTFAALPVHGGAFIAAHRVTGRDDFGNPRTLPYTVAMLRRRYARGEDIPREWECVFNRAEKPVTAREFELGCMTSKRSAA